MTQQRENEDINVGQKKLRESKKKKKHHNTDSERSLGPDLMEVLFVESVDFLCEVWPSQRPSELSS